MNSSALIAFTVVALGFIAVLILGPMSVVSLTKERSSAIEQITGQVASGQLYLGSYPLLPLHGSVYLGGMLAYGAGNAARVVEPGSASFFAALAGLTVSLIVLFSRVLIRKSVIATASPVPTLLVSYSLASLMLFRQAISIRQPAWIRARIDEHKDLLIEVGTRSYETTDVVRIAHPFAREAGVEESIRRAAAVADLWKIESKGYVEFA